MGCWNSGILGSNRKEPFLILFFPLNPSFHQSSIPTFQLGRSP
jgi:hypothetical protein